MEGVKRPEVVILPEGAVLPRTSLISPAPNQFTHEVTRSQPFFTSNGPGEALPTGAFEPGTKVNLLVSDDGEMCRVVDARGLYVLTACAGLRRLT